jgi:lipopolysaccharide assembly protein A
MILSENRLPLFRIMLEREVTMRWFYLAIVIVFVAATLIFVLQNFDLVTMAFLGLRLRAPLAVLVAVIYVLGAITGGSLYALLRHSIRESKASV